MTNTSPADQQFHAFASADPIAAGTYLGKLARETRRYLAEGAGFDEAVRCAVAVTDVPAALDAEVGMSDVERRAVATLVDVELPGDAAPRDADPLEGQPIERDFPGDEELGYHGADEVPAGHPDALDYMGHDPYGGQPCPHSPHWRHCRTCNPEGIR